MFSKRLRLFWAPISILLFIQLQTSPAGIPTEYEKLYDALVSLQPDESKAAVVADLTLLRDVATFHLQSGQLFLCKPVEGRIVAAIFIGKGNFSMKPPTYVEQQQLVRFYESDSLDINFETLFLLFADKTAEELQRRIPFGPASSVTEARNRLKYCIKYVHDEDSKDFHGSFMHSFLHHQRNTLFYAHFSEVQTKPFFFQINPFEEEEVSFFQRGSYSILHYQERITQFHSQAEYLSKTAGQAEDKDLIRITDYRIESRIKDNLDFSASATVVFRPMADNVRWLPFVLFSKLDIDTLFWNAGTPAAYFRGEKSPLFWVQSPRPLTRGEPCSLTVHYNGDLLERDELGWIGLRSSSTWYPRFGIRTRANFDLVFHTPARWTFASVGKKVSAERVGDTLVTRWTTVRPTHNVSFNIGKFKEIQLQDKDARAEKQPGESMPSVSVYEFEFAPRGLGLADLGDEVRADILNSIRFFQHVYGKSPVDEFYATETPYFHGEAFPGLLHLSWATYKLADAKGSNEIFRAHEVAHQWWGVGVNFLTYHDQWLSEAFAEYSGLWYMQAALKNNKKFFDALEKMRERILSNRKFLFGSGQEAGPIWLGYRTHSSSTKGDYDLIVYRKGAWVLHMLRNMMIDLPTMNEDKFKNMMREFYSTYLGKETSTRAFQRIVEKHIGIDMTWFFDQWIMGTSIPEYSFAYKFEEAGGGNYRVRCRIRQQGVLADFRMVVPLLIKFEDNKFVRLRVVVTGDNEVYELPLLPLPPEDIVFNDLSSVLCEVKYEKWK